MTPVPNEPFIATLSTVLRYAMIAIPILVVIITLITAYLYSRYRDALLEIPEQPPRSADNVIPLHDAKQHKPRSDN